MTVLFPSVGTWWCFFSLLFCFSGGAPCLLWIFGHSYVHWGRKRAGDRPAGSQLGFSPADVQVRWLGVRGLRWSRLLSEFQFFVGLDRAPDIVVIHAGGNDLGTRTSRELLRNIKVDCLRLWTSFPGIIIVWSDIVARRVWRHARSVSGLNKARAKLNRSVGRFIARNGGVVVRHRDLEVVDDSLLWTDGEHLNFIGLDIWMLGIQEGVEKALRLWRDEQV